MPNIPANLATDLDTAFGKALYSAGGWQSALVLPFSLSSLLNSIDSGGGSYASLTLSATGTALTFSGGGNIVGAGTINAAGLVTAGGFASGTTSVATSYVQTNTVYGNGNTVVVSGQAGATGVGVAVDNSTTLTSGGKILSLRSGGAEQAYVDYAGSIVSSNNLSAAQNIYGTDIYASNTFQAGTNFVIASGGAYLQANLVGNVSHLIGKPSALPVVSSINAGFGSITNENISGGDLAFILSFTTGTGASIVAGSVICTITLSTGYSNSEYVAICQYGQNGGAIPYSSAIFYCVPTSATTFSIINNVGFTPNSSSPVVLQVLTIGAGATS